MTAENISEVLNSFAKRMDRLEKVLQDKPDARIHFEIRIQDFHLNEMNLDELAFHLDRLDIKELSGMLNMGNTFSPNVQPKGKTREQGSGFALTLPESDRGQDIQILINGDPVAYSVTDGKDKAHE
ncbi:hypothetical protein [Bacillus sp. B-jedd]|uniref:hypothetical protein n=1 Tax=Bacillus sp. B-jedd TaxID=1476857 RepID=UPI000515542A|nr:hypothetical protein [Bacillus sp. B-jedd]CEG25713.1 hypothetical protein BN1002_00529 [Bacillus sp. B-jedd]